MVVIAESIPSSNLMLPLVSIAHRCLENITQPKQLMLNGDPVASGSPRSWFKRTISLTTWYNVILHVHAVVMIVMMQLLSLSLYFFLEISSKVHPPSSTSHLMIISCWCLMVLYGFCVVVHECLAKQRSSGASRRAWNAAKWRHVLFSMVLAVFLCFFHLLVSCHFMFVFLKFWAKFPWHHSFAHVARGYSEMHLFKCWL